MRTSTSVGCGFALEERGRRDEHPGRAEAALHAAVLEERRLERAQLEARREPFDGGHLAALGLERKVRAAVHRLAVEQHHAGAAFRVVAALLRAREADGVAYGREQARPRVELDRIGDAVHVQRCATFMRAAAGRDRHVPPRARTSAAPIARRAITSAIARR